MNPEPDPKGPQVQVAPVHFEDFSGEQFERLAFAYTLRNPKLHSVEWTGQSGGDGGKDIIAKDANDDVHLFLCANYRRLTFEKVQSDIAKIVARRPLKLRYVTIIAGGKVSDELRKKTKAEICAQIQIDNSEVWSGPEFEERLRLRAQDLLRRFVQGEVFPEQPEALRALTISSVGDAMQVDVKTIEAIDPRWNVKLDVINFAKQYTLHPKEDIAGLLKVTGPDVAKMKEHFDYGKPVKLDGKAVAVEGLPLLDHIIREKGEMQSLAITPAKPFKVEFHFWSDRPDGFRFTIPGQITCGHLGLSFVSQLNSGAPLRVEMKILKPKLTAPTGEGTVSVSFAFEEWEKRSLSSLPYFDKLREFAHAIIHRHLIRQEVTLDGNRVTGGTLGIPADREPFELAAAVIENVARAREIASKLGINVLLPNLNNLNPEAFAEVDLAHTILFGGPGPLKGAGFSVSITLPSTIRPAQAIAELEMLCTQGGLTLTKKNQEMAIYGTLASLGDVTYSINLVRLVVPEPGRSQFLAGRSETTYARIESLPESEVIVAVAQSSAGV